MDLLQNIFSPHPKIHELEIISKNASKNMKIKPKIKNVGTKCRHFLSWV
jgi:hypothetical protein